MRTKHDKSEHNMNNGRLDKNDLLKKFDTSESIKYLNGVIDNEIKKSNGMDSDMISECVDSILELKEVKIELTEDEIKKRANSITKKHRVQKKRRFLFRHVAAIIIGVIFSAQFISITTFSFDLFGWTKDKFLALIGIEEQQENISFLSSEAKKYATIDELEKVENIDIIIPDWLPGNIKIIFISYSYDYEEKQIGIIYDDYITTLSIRLNSPFPNTDNPKIYENNNNLFYIFEKSNVIAWEYSGDFYTLTCGFDISEYAYEIIENIK